MDTEKKDTFGEKMMEIPNHGALSLMISIGHRTGLFDVLEKSPPASSEDIAKAASLNERYVREWLAAMVVGKIIEYHPEKEFYSLPKEHAAWLTRAPTSENVALFAQYIPVLGGVEDLIINCFKNGGGVPYSASKRFHEVTAEDSGQTVVSALIDLILPVIPGLLEKLEAGIDVLDVGCGSGRALNLLAGHFPKSRFLGCDFSEEAIKIGRKEALEQGLKNVNFTRQDLSNFYINKPFDFITAFDAIHDQAQNPIGSWRTS